MMTKGSRAVILVASLALGLVYILPLWRIQLEAPQYPEGLGMVIEVDNIVGEKPHDLNNINNLNHYIGMKRIVPDAIPELRLMPMILAGLILLGLITAAVGRRAILYGWVTIFLAVSVVGLADFWKWEYDYGHDLDEETAIIKIPGMSYQPPLIGSRQILNFTAHSWPGAGGWIAIAAALAGLGVAFKEFRTSRGAGAGGAGASALPVVALLAVSLAGCGEPEPRPLAYGTDSCEHCHMGLADDRFGTEFLSTTGKAYVFDSVECLAAWMGSADPRPEAHSVWVTDFADPGTLIRAEEALFLSSPTLQSPMGLGLSAYSRPEDRDGAVNAFGGEPMDWEAVKAFVASRWSDDAPGGHLHPGHGA